MRGSRPAGRTTRASRATPEASLVVRLARVVHAGAFRGTGSGAGSVGVTGTEADLAERLLAEPAVVEAGFRPLATERETLAGAVDVYG